MSIPPSNWFGFLGLCAYGLTLLPTWVKILFPRFKQINIIIWLRKKRRQIGILVFVFSLIHGAMWIYADRAEIMKLHQLGQYWHGLSTLIIFSLLAITSNNWAVKRMKKHWKQLHRLTYLSIFILTVHIWEKMSENWSHLTPSALGIAAVSIALIAMRFGRQWYQQLAQSGLVAPSINR